DAFVSNDTPTKNYGHSADLYTGSSNTTIRRAYFKWDISEAMDLNVTKAEVFLYGDAFFTTSEDTDINYVATDSWKEAGAGNITWSNKPGFAQPAVDTVTVTTGQTWYSFDVTQSILNEIAASDKNVSFVVKGNDEGFNNFENFVRFRPKEYPTEELHPYLNVSFWNSSDPFVNTPPVIINVNIPLSGMEGQGFQISFDATDAENNIVSYNISVDGEQISANNSVSWTPNFENSGTRAITITVSDANGASDTELRTIPIADVQNVVINEFYSNARAGEDEWVELYNPFNQTLNLTNWRIEEAAHYGGTFSSIIPPLGYLGIYAPTLGLADTGDVISLYDSTGLLVDRVSYGSASGNDPNNAPTPPEGNSTGRITDGVDTDVGVDDFAVLNPPTPEATNNQGCVPEGADDDCSGCVEMLELFGYIGEWKAGNVTMMDLFNAISLWKSGVGC
ncbi:MAG TPA: DNRLRE domain-containing protein, partial [Candidatus Nanoarchaeia archaeon]|nr:DNRLRE domain-containing protein [Candidatus Nanoarchaeia archaeon]